MAALRATFVYQQHNINLRTRVPHLEAIPHPDLGRRILIVRTLMRIHNHGGPLQHPDSLLAVLFRTSDGAPIGGAVLDSTPASTGISASPLPTDAFNQQEFNYAPDGFVLAPSDSLGIVISHEPREGINGHTCSVNALIAWRRLKPNEETD